jgi:hypothetical protein
MGGREARCAKLGAMEREEGLLGEIELVLHGTRGRGEFEP